MAIDVSRIHLLIAPGVLGLLFVGSCSGGPKSTARAFYESLAQFQTDQALQLVCEDARKPFERDVELLESLATASQVSGFSPPEFRIGNFSSRFLSLGDDEGRLEVRGRWSAPPYGETDFTQNVSLDKTAGKWCVRPESIKARSQSDDEPDDAFHSAVPEYLRDLAELLTRRLSTALAQGSTRDGEDVNGNATAATPPARPPTVTGKTIQTGSGLQYIDLAVGAGDTPTVGKSVIIHYNGWVADSDALLDSSIERGEVFVFPLGQHLVIEGFEEGISTMKEGGVRRLKVPPDLAYGEQGYRDIPPSATLVFDIALLLVQ